MPSGAQTWLGTSELLVGDAPFPVTLLECASYLFVLPDLWLLRPGEPGVARAGQVGELDCPATAGRGQQESDSVLALRSADDPPAIGRPIRV